MNLIPKVLECNLNGKEIKVRNICLDDNCEFKNFLLNGTDIPFANANADVSLLCVNDAAKIEKHFGEDKIKDTYILQVEENIIKICYADYSGFINAVSTLEQLLLNLILKKEYAVIKIGFIYDSPKYKYRGLLVDVSRHFRSIDELRKTIKMMAFYKLNYLHLHLTDDQGWRIEIKKYPKLTKGGNIRKATQISRNGKTDSKPYGEGLYYTKEDIVQLVAFAAAYGVEIVPEIDVPGHLLGAISQYPDLSCSKKQTDVRIECGVEDIIACASNPYTIQFIKDVLDEVSEMFPCKYFHIGGDEVPKGEWKKCPSCQKKIKELGLKDENELQGWLVNQLTEHLNNKGKDVIIWDENLNIQIQSDSTVIQLWAKKLNKSQSEKQIKEGKKMIVSFCRNFYFDYPYGQTSLKKTYSYSSQTIGLKPEYEKSVLGMEAAMWSEWLRDFNKFEFMLYPRILAFSEKCWSEDCYDYENFENRLKQHIKFFKAKGITYCPIELCNPHGLMGLKQKYYVHSKKTDTYDEMRLTDKLN